MKFDASNFYRSDQDCWLKRNRSDFAKQDDTSNLKEFRSRLKASNPQQGFSVGSHLSDGLVLFDEEDFWVVVECKHGDAKSTSYFVSLSPALRFIQYKLEEV